MSIDDTIYEINRERIKKGKSPWIRNGGTIYTNDKPDNKPDKVKKKKNKKEKNQ